MLVRAVRFCCLSLARRSSLCTRCRVPAVVPFAQFCRRRCRAAAAQHNCRLRSPFAQTHHSPAKPMAAEKGIPIAGAAPQPPLTKGGGSVNVEYPKLIIVKATYGLHKEVDVLTQVRKQQSNQGGGLSFPEKAEFNWTFGDPEPGANKALKLWWKYGDDGDVLEQHWYENGGRKAVLLPKDDRPSDKYHGPLHFTAQKVTDLKEWGTKVKNVFVKLEVAGGAIKAAATKSVDHASSGKEPDFVAAKVPAVTLAFEGQVDAKSTVTISLMSKGLILDDVIAQATVPLATLSGDRSDGRVVELFDEKTRKHLVCKLVYQCTYQGRGGPRALRPAHGGGGGAAPPGGASADPR